MTKMTEFCDCGKHHEYFHFTGYGYQCEDCRNEEMEDAYQVRRPDDRCVKHYPGKLFCEDCIDARNNAAKWDDEHTCEHCAQIKTDARKRSTGELLCDVCEAWQRLPKLAR